MCARSEEIEAERRTRLLSFSARPRTKKPKPTSVVPSDLSEPTPLSDGYLVGCYVMHLYCACFGHNHYGHGRGEATGQTEREAIADARRAGWVIVGKGTKVVCPRCARKAEHR